MIGGFWLAVGGGVDVDVEGIFWVDEGAELGGGGAVGRGGEDLSAWVLRNSGSWRWSRTLVSGVRT